MEIEGIALRHPGIADAAAVGVPDPRYGERVGLVIVPAAGAPAVTVEELRAFFVERGVASMKAPEVLAVVDELPRNASGKVTKHVLRDTADFASISQ
jgi:acyl-CoA synthetase (AMP-forming)/AMP-acid ligase II